MDYCIRELRKSEFPLLEHFLYEAIFIPNGCGPVSPSVLALPELRLYIDRFGEEPHDLCSAAECNGAVVGALWSRMMQDYGHIDGETPSLAMSVDPDYRGLGIGTALLRAHLTALQKRGYARVSLSVQKANAALRLYRRLGFSVIGETEEEYVMAANLRS